MGLPGTLGQTAPPDDGDIQRTLRNLQQQIDALVTAQTVQSAQTSAFITKSYNGSTDGLTFPGGDSATIAHEGSVAAPITCSSVVVHAVVTAGDTGGGALLISATIRNDQEGIGAPGTVSDSVATEVQNFASLTTSYVRVLPGMSAGSHVHIGVAVNTTFAGSPGDGNGHVSAMVVFIR